MRTFCFCDLRLCLAGLSKHLMFKKGLFISSGQTDKLFFQAVQNLICLWLVRGGFADC